MKHTFDNIQYNNLCVKDSNYKSKRAMHTREIDNKLKNQVTNYLKTQYNIPLSLPNYNTRIQTKVNLKFLKIRNNPYNHYYTPNEPYSDHRYTLIIDEAQDILKSDTFEAKRIDNFMALFLETINNDIQTMQKNQTIRDSSYRNRQKLIYRSQQTHKATEKINSASETINDRQQLLSFVAVDFKNFIELIRLVFEDFESTRNIEVYTTLKIDDIFNPNITEQDYADHYGHLLEVLVRLKSNMLNLYKEFQESQKINMPMKSVNLLANCKNLLIELSQFLIEPDCAFNRLIFHVVQNQNQSIKLVSQLYQRNMMFVQGIGCSIQKAVYLDQLFPMKYDSIKQRLETEEALIVQIFIRLRDAEIIAAHEFKQAESKLEQRKQPLKSLRSEIRFIKKIIGSGQIAYMVPQINEKICQRIKSINQHKMKVLSLQSLVQLCYKYLTQMKKLSYLIENLPEFEENTKKQMEIIKKVPDIDDLLQQQHRGAQQQPSEARFRHCFDQLQNKMIQCSQITMNFNSFKQRSYNDGFYDVFETKKQHSDLLNERYLNMETKLLNSFQHFIKRKESEEEESIKTINIILKQTSDYLNQGGNAKSSSIKQLGQSRDRQPISQNIGFEICNEDEYSDITKQMLDNINNCEFMIKNRISSENTPIKKSYNFNRSAKQIQVQRYKLLLEWLLIIFEGSMDEKVLESMTDRMDFKENNADKIQKNISKVNQLLTQFNKYNKNLQKIAKQIQLSRREQDELSPSYSKTLLKVYKISKERLILNQLLESMFYEMVSVYSELKMNGESLESSGITVFDQRTYENAIRNYQCLNRIGILSKQIDDTGSLPKKTHNYMMDEIYEPYSYRLTNHINYNQQQLLKLISLLQSSIKLEGNLSRLAKNIDYHEKQAMKNKSKEALENLENSYQEFLQLYSIIGQLKAVEKDFVINNPQKILELQQKYSNYAEKSKNYSKQPK